jgi:hypothetical protein
MLLNDLGISARAMRAEPIRISWKGDCRFYRDAGGRASSAPVSDPAPAPSAQDAAALESAAQKEDTTPTQ